MFLEVHNKKLNDIKELQLISGGMTMILWIDVCMYACVCFMCVYICLIVLSFRATGWNIYEWDDTRPYQNNMRGGGLSGDKDVTKLVRSWKLLCVSHSVVSRHFATPWTVALQVPLSPGILQARILQCIVMPSSRGSSQPRDWTQVSCTGGRFFTVWATNCWSRTMST